MTLSLCFLLLLVVLVVWLPFRVKNSCGYFVSRLIAELEKSFEGFADLGDVGAIDDVAQEELKRFQWELWETLKLGEIEIVMVLRNELKYCLFHRGFMVPGQSLETYF
ncbi:hypothetical protein V6N12_070866 [Hibiscus sabdariffa]|uniref:Uncharacterized protein n=1 Tax=Hibiscus sabdariffa TaxID=183260 RepID=A0ABR2FI42_9ROSI